MPVEDKPVRRMRLRELLTHAEKCARDLIEHFHTTMLTRMSDFRDLSRPVRRKSHYPTLIAVANALRKLQQAADETASMADYLAEHLDAIKEHAGRERVNRL